MSAESQHLCAVCELRASIAPVGGGAEIDCVACGHYRLSHTAATILEDAAKTGKLTKTARWVLAHKIRTLQVNNVSPVVTSDLVERWLDDATPPSPQEQASNLLRWIGDNIRSKDPSSAQFLPGPIVAAIIGAVDEDGVTYIAQGLESEGFLTDRGSSKDGTVVGMTFRGWDRYDELQRAHSEGPISFMAMPFGKDAIDQAYKECFQPACRRAGFDLRRLDTKPEAGLIDNRMRVEIRRSRFLVADLTNENRGAYWEAGFAEGLGKPVIYTCERSYFDANKGTHFDVNHHQTILWDADNLKAAEHELATTVRATLPAEAKLSDD